MTWQQHAACRDLPAALFIEWHPSIPDANTIDNACRHQCPVRLQCAQQALAKAQDGQEYAGAYIAGVWHVPATQATDTTRWRTIRILLAVIRAYTPKDTS